MCQQGWIMHIPPLPLLSLPLSLPPSTSCLQSFLSLFITAATSEDVFTLPHPPVPSLPPSLPFFFSAPSAKKKKKDGTIAATVRSLWSGQPLVRQLTHTYPPLQLEVKPRRVFLCALHDQKKNKPHTLHPALIFTRWLSVCTTHYPIMWRGRAAVDSVWQLHVWLLHGHTYNHVWFVCFWVPFILFI